MDQSLRDHRKKKNLPYQKHQGVVVNQVYAWFGGSDFHKIFLDLFPVNKRKRKLHLRL